MKMATFEQLNTLYDYILLLGYFNQEQNAIISARPIKHYQNNLIGNNKDITGCCIVFFCRCLIVLLVYTLKGILIVLR